MAIIGVVTTSFMKCCTLSKMCTLKSQELQITDAALTRGVKIMVVYGKYKSRYDLITPAYHRDNDGEYYKVKSMPDKQAKLYFKNFRTKEQEYKVISAINGDMPLEKEDPIEVVYHNGRFAGYITDFEESYDMPEETDIGVIPGPTGISFSPTMGVIFCAIIGLVLSAVLYLFVFNHIASLCSETVAFYNFNGFPMMVGGIAALVFCAYYFKDRAGLSVLLSIPAYTIGAALIFLVIFVLVNVIEIAMSLIVPVISFLIVAALVVWGIKYLLKSLGIRF